MSGLRIHKLADKTGGPNADGSWPLAGVRILDGPDAAGISTTVVEQGIREGWLSAEGARTITRPGGPPDDRDRPDKMHTFRHADVLVFHTVDGDVRFKVTHQPDKYADPAAANDTQLPLKLKKADDTTKVTDELYEAGATRVDHFYGIEREG